jgi:hypothetical protein
MTEVDTEIKITKCQDVEMGYIQMTSTPTMMFRIRQAI